MKKKITSASLLKRNQDQLFSDIDGEVVMLSINNREYYSFDRISSEIWNMLYKPTTFHELINELLENYEVSEEKCIIETKQLLEELMQKGLVKIINE